MIEIKIIKMSLMMSWLILCPLITFAQLYSAEINVEQTPFIADITIECLGENIRFTVHPEDPLLPTTYTMIITVPPVIGIPETNTTGVFIIPNLQMLQSALFLSNSGNCTDSREITFDCSSLLPLSIISVYAKLKNETEAEIAWEIANELNVKQYIVEKSANGSIFSPIVTVLVSTDVSDIKIYNYEDASLYSGINYYRIRIEDLDGSIYYTKIVSVYSERGQLISFKVYPNTTINNLYVEYTNTKATFLNISIYSYMGQLVSSTSYTDGAISNIIELSVNNLTSGMYIIKATDQQGNESVSKFFKAI